MGGAAYCPPSPGAKQTNRQNLVHGTGAVHIANAQSAREWRGYEGAMGQDAARLTSPPTGWLEEASMQQARAGRQGLSGSCS
jgi:hypothetical protein